jgi:hypothetical protein
MSGIMLNVVGGTFVAPVPIVGSAYAGGFFAGQISTAGNGIADYNLVVGPLSSAQNTSVQFKTSQTDDGTVSKINGPANSASMNDANHPAAQFCEGLTVGGFSDWYMPAYYELDVCYFNLKPTTYANDTGSGINPNAIPARASYYTAGNPAQTSATNFQSTGSEPFIATLYANAYWNSTQYSPERAYLQTFLYGAVAFNVKTATAPVRAIRRVAV